MKQRTQIIMERTQEIVLLQQQHQEMDVTISEKIVTLEQFLDGKKKLPKLGDAVAEKMNHSAAQKAAATKRRQKAAKAKPKAKAKARRTPRGSIEERGEDVIKEIKASKNGITKSDARKTFGGSSWNKECDKFLRKAKKDGILVLKTMTTKNARGRKQTGKRWFVA